jgi:hypothetical protein
VPDKSQSIRARFNAERVDTVGAMLGYSKTALAPSIAARTQPRASRPVTGQLYWESPPKNPSLAAASA